MIAPLALLRADVVVPTEPVIYRNRPYTLLPGTDADGYITIGDAASHKCPRRDEVSLDLSEPADGSRIDGATVAATMLAKAAGLDTPCGVQWRAYDYNARGVEVVIVTGVTGAADWSHRLPSAAIGSDRGPRAILAAVLLAVCGAP